MTARLKPFDHFLAGFLFHGDPIMWFRWGTEVYGFSGGFPSSATMMSPANPSHAKFLVLDFDARSGI
jgi:hypothetical protein